MEKAQTESKNKISVGQVSASILNGPVAHPAAHKTSTGVSFPGIKLLGRGVSHQTPSSVEVKQRVHL